MNLSHNALPQTELPQMDLMEAWEDDLKRRYPRPENEKQFRNYDAEARNTVKEFYRQNHRYQTFAFVQEKKQEYTALKKRRMSVWEGMEFLNTLVDDSDPDVDFTQIEHLMQTAEAIRRDGQPRWFILVGLLHDLGKVLCLYGEPQWAVVGDTFPVGCAYSEKIVYPEFFAENPDAQNPVYNTPNGIYRAGCGLDNVHLSWGHDEYLYHVMKDYLPPEALAMIRYHSFYPGHKEGAYTHLMNAHDHEMLKAVRAFNPYDLYSKGLERPNVEALRPYYEALIAEFLPSVLDW